MTRGWMLARRAGAGLLVVWGAATVVFLAFRLVPGEPVDALLGPGSAATPELRAELVRRYGLDRPAVVQYLDWLAGLARGDLGHSYQLDQPVTAALAGQVLPTVQLALAATVIAVSLAVAGAVATAGRGRVARAAASGLELVAVSIPSFWLGLVALSLVSFRWRLVPVIGADGPGALLLPAATLAIPLAGVLGQVLREGMEAALREPFVLSVRARGVAEPVLRVRHVLRHASLTLVTLAGWVVGSLFGGAVLTETVFARPGLGRVLMTAVVSRDLPVVGALVVLSALAFSVVNLAVDLLYPVIDPRLPVG